MRPPASKTPHLNDRDHLALAAALHPGAVLCTVVGIEGSFSRRLGAQLAILADGRVIGDLSDGCLEAELVNAARQAQATGQAVVTRYGQGGAAIDFRLPCGGGLDILIDPAPDLDAISGVVAQLRGRHGAQLMLRSAGGDAPFVRNYVPQLRIFALGHGPELEAFVDLATHQGTPVTVLRPKGSDDGVLTLGQAPDVQLDPFTAVMLLFHDHEWEVALLPWALESGAGTVAAMGGNRTRQARAEMAQSLGAAPHVVDALRQPMGLIPAARDPHVLALSAYAQIVGWYEQQRGAAATSDVRPLESSATTG